MEHLWPRGDSRSLLSISTTTQDCGGTEQIPGEGAFVALSKELPSAVAVKNNEVTNKSF